jgi:hypothetical protein
MKMRAILVTKDDRYRGDVDRNLLELATVEVLRACAFAAEAVLIPATMHLFPFAAVIAHDIRQIAGERDGRVRVPTGRFVPIAQDPSKVTEALRPFLRADLGAPTRDPDKGQDVLSFAAAMAEYPPEVVVALTTDAAVVGPLSSLKRKPRVLYFGSLLRGHTVDFEKQFKPLANGFIDLEHDFVSVDDVDKESGRSHDEGLELFVPFGVLLQEALWPEEGAMSR